jgi:hypothetical protein
MMFLSGRLGALSSAGGLLNLAFTAAEACCFCWCCARFRWRAFTQRSTKPYGLLNAVLPLRRESVKQMPRAHPRCGTNLVALAGLIQITLGHLPSYDPFLVLLSLLFIYFGWRTFGTLLQEWFTTRPPFGQTTGKRHSRRRRINGKISGTAACDGFVRAEVV